MTNRHYTLKELSKELKISIRMLRDYIRQGQLKAARHGRAYKVSPYALEEFLNAGVVLSHFGVGEG